MAIFATTANASAWSPASPTQSPPEHHVGTWAIRDVHGAGIAMYTATKATAGAFGATSVTTSGAGVNAGAVIAIAMSDDVDPERRRAGAEMFDAPGCCTRRSPGSRAASARGSASAGATAWVAANRLPVPCSR